MVQLFLTIFMIVTYALAAAILTYVSICSIEDSKDQQQFDTIAKSIEEQNEDGDTGTTNKVYDLMLKNKDCVGWLKVVDMDANCNIGISKNLIIYGHNMKNGRMFAPLMKFKNKECFDEHQIIEFVTPNEKAIYHIVCVAKVKADDSWYSFIEDSGESHYNERIKELYSKSLYHSDYEFGYNDEFLTLSTCEYSQNDGRLIVVAVKEGANSNV